MASGLADNAGLGQFSLLDPAKIAAPIAVIGLALILLTASRLVPARRPPHAETDPVSGALAVRMTVVEERSLDGVTVDLANLRHLDGV